MSGWAEFLREQSGEGVQWRGAQTRHQRKRPPDMPVDHPDAAPVAVRRIPSRTLTVALSFFVTLGALFVLSPLLQFGTIFG